MPTKFDKEIAVKGLEARLMAQKGSLFTCEAEILKHEQHIQRYRDTIESLKVEIEKTEDMIKEQKGGEK